MPTPTTTLTILDAYSEYLDEMRVLTTHAHRCPLGLSDPDQPLTGWCYSLPDDPGHTGSLERQTRDVFIHQGLISIWYHREGQISTQFLWRVAWVCEAGWHTQWYVRRPGQSWESYPSDFVLDTIDLLPRGLPLPAMKECS